VRWGNFGGDFHRKNNKCEEILKCRIGHLHEISCDCKYIATVPAASGIFHKSIVGGNDYLMMISMMNAII
jgi:hypothetical protein